MEQIKLPGGIILKTMDKVNFITNLFIKSKGQITSFKNIGQYGWMNIFDGKNYEWVSVAVQLEKVGEKNILISE